MRLVVTWINNEDWQRGQFSSIQAGLNSILAAGLEGTIVLPVDVVGTKSSTVSALIETALRNPHLNAVIPEYKGKGGHPIYLSRNFCEHLMTLNCREPNARLDIEIQKINKFIHLPVNDPCVTRNVNTEEEWKNFLSSTDYTPT